MGKCKGVCIDCGRILTDEIAYDDTICSECYLAELEAEAQHEE